ncbi:MAG: glycosyltransferase [Chlorobi bacterium]|nr:glycosyltransferase [Chlorobiota bacterium]MBX7215470.1 glycosyltransferase [Candidatus Kapabacteria bacterium]
MTEPNPNIEPQEAAPRASETAASAGAMEHQIEHQPEPSASKEPLPEDAPLQIEFPPKESAIAPRRAARPGRGRVLIVSYYFPPIGLGHVLRIARLAKHLTEFGWEPTVLTVNDVGYFVQDFSLLEEVLESGVQVERTKTMDPVRLLGNKRMKKVPVERYRGFLRGVSHTFLQPDNKIGWKRYALQRAIELMEERPFDLVLATAPPFTDFMIGRELQKRYGLPLVVDYQETWLDNPQQFYATPIHRSYAAGLEEEILKNADACVVVTRRIKERLIARYPFLTHDSVHIIPGGYDIKEFQNARRHTVRPQEKMRITYCGAFDARHTPKYFFQALAKIFAQHPQTRGEIEAVFVGVLPEVFRKMATNIGVASALVSTGYVEHQNVPGLLLSSHLLWLANYHTASVPGKVYEYMGSGRPILALTEKGALTQTLAVYGAATVVPPTDPQAIAEALLDSYHQWKSGTLPEGRREAAEEYDQRKLAERLARVLAYSVRI